MQIRSADRRDRGCPFVLLQLHLQSQGESAAAGAPEWDDVASWLETLGGTVLLSIAGVEQSANSALSQVSGRSCIVRVVQHTTACLPYLDLWVPTCPQQQV